MRSSRGKRLNQSVFLLVGIVITLVVMAAHRLLPERRLLLDGAREGAVFSLSQHVDGPPVLMDWIDERKLHFTCRFAEDSVGQNCIFAYLLYSTTADRGIDLSGFRSLTLNVRYSGDAQFVRVGIRNFDPRFSIVEDWNSPKFNSVNVRAKDFARPVRISLSEFTVPEWWETMYDLPRELNRPDLSNATVVTFDLVGHHAGSLHEFQIDRIEFTGPWISAESWYLGILCAWLLLATTYGLSQWLRLRRKHREQRRKIHALVDTNAQLQSEKEKYRKLSTIDALTGVMNRHGIEQYVESIHAAGTSASVIVIDLDHFKRINDQRGHHIGDRVLEAVSDVLKSQIRAADGLGRWGGEEFVLVCPGTSLPQAADLAEKLRRRIMDTNFIPEDPLTVTASFGVAAVNAAQGFEDAFRQADQALYLAKSRGRNCVVAATEDQLHKVTGARKSTWALISGRFKLHH